MLVKFPEKLLFKPISTEFVPLTFAPAPIAIDLDPDEILFPPRAIPVPDTVLFSPNARPPFVAMFSLPNAIGKFVDAVALLSPVTVLS